MPPPRVAPEELLDKIEQLAATPSFQSADPGLADWIAGHRTALLDVCERVLDGDREIRENPDRAAKRIATTPAITKPQWRGDPAQLERARRVMPKLQRMAKTENRTDPAYYERGLPIVAQLLGRGIRPGDDQGGVKLDGTFQGRWKLLEDDDEGLRLAVLAPYEARDWMKEVPGARYATFDGLRWVVCNAKQTLRASRALEDLALPLALALRIAFLLDTEQQPSFELSALARATRIEDIEDPHLRQRVAHIVNQVRFPPGLHAYPFQQIGIAYAALSGFRCLIGDSMGLGKTVQALGCIALAPAQLLPGLVVAPSSTVHNWAREARKWTPWLDVVVIESGDTEIRRPRRPTLFITSWDLLHVVIEEMVLLGIRFLVLDESHYAKNPQSRRTRAAMALARKVPHVLELSGTPMENRPIELWTQLHMLDPVEFPDREDFGRRYAQLNRRVVQRRNRDGQVREFEVVDDTGADNLEELSERLHKYMVRRLKTQVLADLPDKVRSSIWVTLPPQLLQAYQRAEVEMFEWMCGHFRRRALAEAAKRFRDLVGTGVAPNEAARIAVQEANAQPPDAETAKMAIVRLGHLRRLIGEAKTVPAVAWIADFFEASPGPLVVFVEHQAVLQALGNALNQLAVGTGRQRRRLRWTYIDGAVPRKVRTERIAAFQNGAFDVMVGTKAIREGITLTRASDVLFVERWWVPPQEEQAEDRCYRIGQKNTVNVYRLMAEGTVDEQVAELVDTKRQVVEEVLGGERVVVGETQHNAGDDSEVSRSLATQLVYRITAALRHGNDRNHSATVTLADLQRYLKQGG